MTECYCERCTSNPKPTYTEAYRAETEARQVLAMPGKKARLEYFSLVAEKRGADSANKLKADAMRLWRARGAKK